MLSSSNLTDYLDCPICLQLCDNPVEISCCGHLFCNKCIINLDICPLCKLNSFKLIESRTANRIIDSLVINCEYCNVQIQKGNYKFHLNNCTKSLYKCFVCYESYIINEFMIHFIKSHPEEYNKYFIYIYLLINCKILEQNKEELKNKESDDIIEAFKNMKLKKSNVLTCIDNINLLTNYDNIYNDNSSSFSSKVNSLGFLANLGKTGKFYCSKELKFNCACCDNKCGEYDGCNCRECMMLDIKFRNLPKYWFVNREGINCKLNREGVCCGRKSNTNSLFNPIKICTPLSMCE